MCRKEEEEEDDDDEQAVSFAVTGCGLQWIKL
jgi:hypothetical protein